MKESYRITYVGSFPPPYGGVTVKNALLYKHLSEKLDIEKLDLTSAKRLEPRAVWRLLCCILSRSGVLVIGVSAGWCYRLTSILYSLNRKKMLRSFLMIMGGKTPESATYVGRMNSYRRVYVETGSMKRSFEAMGSSNVAIYPNCRERPNTQIEIKHAGDRISCVFFSRVSPDKGAHIVLGAARELPQVDFHFYGRIEDGYEEEFFSAVEMSPNVWYHGIYDSVDGDVIGELNKYDVHLFPTCFPNEGVPGVLVETKLAAVPSIVSDICHNAELVRDGKDGIVLKQCCADALATAIEGLVNNSDALDDLKAGALASSDSLYIDKYVDMLVTDLTDAAKES